MRSIRNFFITFFISLIGFGIIAWVIWGNVGPKKDKSENDGYAGVVTQTSDQTDSDNSVVEAGENITAVLCCYEDYPGSPDSGRADSIMLINLDKRTKQFTICPIPSYIKLDIGTETTKSEVYLGDVLKNSNKEKGRENFLGKIEALTGLPVDFYLFISTSEFVNIINEIGGIEYNVPVNMYYKNAQEQVLVNLKSGKKRLSGEEALQLVRYRSYGVSANDDGGEERSKTQAQFLLTLLRTFLKPEKNNTIGDIVSNLLKLLSDKATNFTVTSFLEYKDVFMDFENYNQEIVNYPTSSKIITLSNGEKLAVHTPDIDYAVEDVFGKFREE